MSRRSIHRQSRATRQPARSLGLETLEDRSVPSSFYDNFEGQSLNPFWQTEVSSGTVVFPSTSPVHAGSQAVRLNTFMSSAHKGVNLRHFFDTPQYGKVSVWFYDTGAGVPSSNAIYFNTYNPAAGLAHWGVWDYDFRRHEDNYIMGIDSVNNQNDSSTNTSFNRSLGWHKWELNVVPNSVTFSMDGQALRTVPVDMPFTRILFGMGAPNWRPAWTTSFDDFEFTEHAPTDLVAESFVLNPVLGGPAFTYSITDASLPQPATAEVYFASGPNWDDRIGDPVFQTPLQSQQGTYGPILVPRMSLPPIPSGATHLLLALDPANQIAESEESNNTLALPLFGSPRMGSPNAGSPNPSPKPGVIAHPTASAAAQLRDSRSTITIAAPTDWAAPSKPLRSVELPAAPPADPFELHGVALAE